MRRRAYLSAVAGVSVAGCSAVGGAGWGSGGGEPRPDLSIGWKSFEHQDGRAAVRVEIANNSEISANTVELKADWLNEQGEFIETSRKDLTELPGGWIWQPKIRRKYPETRAHDVKLRLDWVGGEANYPESIDIQLENGKGESSWPSTTVVVKNTGDEEEQIYVGAQFIGADVIILGEDHRIIHLPPGVTWRFDATVRTVHEVSPRPVAIYNLWD